MASASSVRTHALAHYRAEFPVRLSPYFYNAFEDNATAIEALTT